MSMLVLKKPLCPVCQRQPQANGRPVCAECQRKADTWDGAAGRIFRDAVAKYQGPVLCGTAVVDVFEFDHVPADFVGWGDS